MARCPEILIPKTPVKPKPPVQYRRTALTVAQYNKLPHHCPGLPPTHCCRACQMGTDAAISAGLVYEQRYDAEFDKTYWVGIRPAKP